MYSSRHTVLALSLLLLLASCGKHKYADSPEELGRVVTDAIKKNDVDALLQYYPTLDEAKKFQADFIVAEMPMYLMIRQDSLNAADRYEKTDKGYSDLQLSGLYLDSNRTFRMRFKTAVRAEKRTNIDWKFERVELPLVESRRNGDKPTWMRIWYTDGKDNRFFVLLQNCIKADQGWCLGLEMDSGITKSTTYEQRQVDSAVNAMKQELSHLVDSVNASKNH